MWIKQCETKIGNGEYVDFAKLMPKDRHPKEDHRMGISEPGWNVILVASCGQRGNNYQQLYQMGASISCFQ